MDAAKAFGVNLLRINLSHTRSEDLSSIIKQIRSMSDIPICIDSEGAQIRTGNIISGSFEVRENSTLSISHKTVPGSSSCISLNPPNISKLLKIGDFVSIDFNSVFAQVVTVDELRANLKILIGGKIGQNKAITIQRHLPLPAFTDKDLECFEIAKCHGIKNYALSFAQTKEDVQRLRTIVGPECHIISKIECREGVQNLSEIAKASDAILIDRGDLSRQVDISKIPSIQKEIIRVAKEHTKVYVATNLLESMITSPEPTRAEVNDIYNTLSDGADGLVLAAETAIGKYPEKAVEMVAKVIHEFTQPRTSLTVSDDSFFTPGISYLQPPHGGKLVQQALSVSVASSIKDSIEISTETALDCEQIAEGTYSPLTGFLTQKELQAVLSEYCLPNGLIWTMPILLQVQAKTAQSLKVGQQLVLRTDSPHAIIEISDIYPLDQEDIAIKWFGTASENHPGVAAFKKRGNWAIGGRVFQLKKENENIAPSYYSPAQSRFVFDKKGWRNIIGFHTRNVPHRVHEHIQKLAMNKVNADGLYITPVVGPKKLGDFQGEPVLKCYQALIDFGHYPADKVMLGSFRSYSRFSGPREAVFTALCRKNMGCNYFILGRDHTGVGDFYRAGANEELFVKLGEIGIKPLFFEEFVYCVNSETFIEANIASEPQKISGTQVRHALKNNQKIPHWFMRDVVQSTLFDLMSKGQDVFF